MQMTVREHDFLCFKHNAINTLNSTQVGHKWKQRTCPVVRDLASPVPVSFVSVVKSKYVSTFCRFS